LLDRAVRGRIGRPPRRPRTLIADRDYDYDKYRRLVWQRGIKPIIARRQTEHGSGLGRHGGVVERPSVWRHNLAPPDPHRPPRPQCGKEGQAPRCRW
jgi:hypothetical protein